MVISLMRMGLGMAITKVYYLLTAITLVINGIADLEDRRVYTLPVIITLLCGIFISPYPTICIVGLIFAVFLTDDRIQLKWIGAGDIDALSLICSALGITAIPYLIFASTMALVWSRIQHEKAIPYVYFIGLSYLIFCTEYFFD